MSQPFIGEVRLVPYNFAPRGWAFCDGQLMSIAENEALFALIGTIYGGNGQTNFGLPDLRGRVVQHQNQSFQIGESFGVESVTLTASQMPAHGHQMHVNPVSRGTASPINNVLTSSGNAQVYGSSGDVVMNISTSAGSNQPHDNRQPYLVLHYVIALEGIFPSQN